ncbi:MAG: methyltransferase domain-containing protein [Anaerolinea sp.]|nr:methyltransferase domain-containing protein [Anaerolinea sp.]
MKKQFKPLVIIVGIIAGISLWWRYAARRRSLPCPPWLDWMLENRYVETVANSQAIVERLHLQPGMSVLDVGCGPGRVAIPAAKHVGPDGIVVALDMQADMLQRLRKRMTETGVTNIHPLHAGIGEGKVEIGVFDRAVLVTVLGEIPDREAALAEIYQTLKPGGLLSVTEFIPDPHYQSRETVRRLAAAADFREQASFGNWLAFTLNFTKFAKPDDT